MSALYLRPPISPGYCHSIYRDPHGSGWVVAQVANGVANEELARVFVAAPEMLAALKAIAQFIPSTSASDGGAAMYSENVKAADMVRAAIAKAEGKA